MRIELLSRKTFSVLGRLLIVFTVIAAANAPNGVARAQVSAARFGLTIDGVQIASFSRFDSLVDAAATGGTQAMSLTGGHGYFPQMAAWHELVILGDVAAARKSCVVVVYNQAGAPIARYHLENAWPAKYTGASTNGLRTEGVVLVYETARVEKP